MVVYGQPSPEHAARKDEVDLDARIGEPIRNYWFFNYKLLYQPVWKHICRADLVIVEQANKHLINFPLLLGSKLGIKKVALWGHGRDRSAKPGSWGEKVKRRLIAWPSWWFAYTRGIAGYVATQGMPEDRITAVQNSVDTRGFAREVGSVQEHEIQKLKRTISVDQNARIGIYCGGLHKAKCLEFLIDSGGKIYNQNPGFRLLVVGDGSEKETITGQKDVPWLRYLGPKFGREKAVCFAAAELFLCPGLVGLAILDAFAAGLPLITTDITTHSPEIEYLEQGVNGLMTGHNADTYAESVCHLFNNQNVLTRMQENACFSASAYSIENMADNFVRGIRSCLAF